MKRWIKWPEPGQFRGQGKWIYDKQLDDYFEYCRKTGYLPTHIGDTPPKEDEDENAS